MRLKEFIGKARYLVVAESETEDPWTCSPRGSEFYKCLRQATKCADKLKRNKCNGVVIIIPIGLKLEESLDAG